MARAASIRPGSTSRIAPSTMRAMKGVAAMVSGTIAAEVPIEVPATRRVNGMIATTRMMNGVERVALTTAPSTALATGAAKISPPRRWRGTRRAAGRTRCRCRAGDADHVQRVEQGRDELIDDRRRQQQAASTASGDIAENLRRQIEAVRAPRGPHPRSTASPGTATISVPNERPAIGSIWPARMLTSTPSRRVTRDSTGSSAFGPVNTMRRTASPPGTGSGTRRARSSSDSIAPVTAPTKLRVVSCRGWANTSKVEPCSTTRPRSSTATRSAIDFTTLISWVISTTVRCSSRRMRAISARICWVVSGSSAEVASSHSSTFGRTASARAMPTRCFWPPDSSDGIAVALRRKADQVEQLVDAGGDVAARPAGDLQRQRDVGGGGARAPAA